MAKKPTIGINELIIEHGQSPSLLEHLKEDFEDLMSNKEVLQDCILKFIDQIVDQATLGIIFDLHRKYKTKAYCLEIDEGPKEDDTEKDEDLATSSGKTSRHQCVCPNCAQTVASLRFARHLAKCMGIRSSRHASRRAATNKEKGEASKYTTGGPSDDDDEDWNPRKNKKKDKNGGKKSKGKKSSETDSPEAATVDVEGTSEEDANPRLVMIQSRRHVADPQEQRSSSSSPTEGTSGGSGTSRKRDKLKKKSKGKERGSPSTSLNLD